MAKNRPRTKRLLTDELYIPNVLKPDLRTSKINGRHKNRTIKTVSILFLCFSRSQADLRCPGDIKNRVVHSESLIYSSVLNHNHYAIK